MSAREELFGPEAWARARRVAVAGAYGAGVAWKLLAALQPGSARQCAAGAPVQLVDASGEDGLLELPGAGRGAEAGVLVIDASRPEAIAQGAAQAERLGAPRIVVAVDGMDEVGYARAAFERAREAFLRAAAGRPLPQLAFVPVSSRDNELVAERGGRAGWYDGPTLLEALFAPAPAL